MSGLPKVTIVGKLTADPEIRMLPSGVSVANFTIVANERKFNKDTNTWEQGAATFLKASLWRQYGENVAESLRRGDQVIAVGEMVQRDWEKDGVKRSSMELNVDEIGPTLRFTTVSVARGDRQPATASAASAASFGAGGEPWVSAPIADDPGW